MRDIRRLGELLPGALAVYQIRDDSISMLYFSEGLPSLLGFTHDEYVARGGGDITDLVVPQDRLYVRGAIEAALRHHEDVNCSYRAIFDDGEYHWMNVRGRYLGQFEGFPLFAAQFLDTTQETKLHASLVDQAENGVYVCDATTRELFYVNKKAHDLWRKSDDFLGQTCHRYFRNLDAPCPWCAFNDMEGDFVHVEDSADPDLEGYLKVDCRKIVWFGRPAFCVSFTDVTGERRAQQEMQQAKEELDELVGNLPAAVIVYRKIGDEVLIVQANGAVGEIVGLSEETILMQGNEGGIAEHVHPADRDMVNAGVERLFSAAHEVDITYRNRPGENAPYRWLHFLARSFPQEDGNQIAYAVISDATETMERKHAEESIVDLIGNLPVTSVLYEATDNDGGAIPKSISDEFCRMCGMTQQQAWDLYSHDAYAAVHPDDVERLRNFVAAHRNDSSLQSITHRLRRSDGAWFWVSASVSWFSVGGVAYAYTIYTDIDEVKRREAELNRRYLEEQSYLDSVGDSYQMTMRMDVTANRIETVAGSQLPDGDIESMAYDEMLEVVFLPAIVHDDERAAVRSAFSREAIIEAARRGEKTISQTFASQPGAGPPQWLRVVMNLIERPETDHVVAFATVENIDEEMFDQQVFDRIVNSDGCDFIAVVDAKRRTVDFRRVSDGARAQLASTARDFDEAMAANARANRDDDERAYACHATSIETVVGCLEHEDSYSCTYSFVDATGACFRKLMSFSYLDRTEQVVLAICTDITEAYLKEQADTERLQEAVRAANEANQAKTDFLSRMSHDIRTPLNGVIGMTGLALDEEVPPSVREYLERIDESGKFLLSLVNDILDMSKAESGKMELQAKRYSYEEFHRYIMSVIKPLCDEKDIEFVTKVPNTAPDVLVDKLRFNQIFFNLLSNSVKFTPNGGHVTFSARFKKSGRADGACFFKFIVKDDGIGMSEEYQRKLFTPFEQENAGRNDARVGSGLGLSIVKTIVDLMGGTIAVKSQKGRGTKFTVKLCLRVAADGAGREHSPAEPSAEGSGDTVLAGRNVLLVEDNAINVEVASLLLEKRGIAAQVARNGEEALRAFEDSQVGFFDAVLMDVRMPMMDGLEATRRIRALQRGDARTVPVIAMTANAYEDDVRECFDAGMDAHVAKPIVPEDLFATMVRMMDDSRAR